MANMPMMRKPALLGAQDDEGVGRIAQLKEPDDDDEPAEILPQGLEAEFGDFRSAGRGGILGKQRPGRSPPAKAGSRLARTMTRKVPSSSSPLPPWKNQTMARAITRPQKAPAVSAARWKPKA